MEKKTLTIFTPTYNRAYILPKLYESLCNEQCHDFIWLVVDDGSTDNTQELFEQWEKENTIEIHYFKKENGGKMRAHNFGAKVCKTPLFFCIDSDDQLTAGAIEKIISYYDEIKNDDSVCGFIAKKRMDICNFSKTIPSNSFLSLSGLYDSGFTGETSLVFKTDILRKFPFLEVEGEKFSTEAYAYMQMDQKYVYKLKDEYWTDCMYQPDGYSMNGVNLYFSSPIGWRKYFSLSYKLGNNNLKKRVKTMAMYVFSSIVAKCNALRIIRESPSILFAILSYPIGLYYYFKLKNEYERNKSLRKNIATVDN